MSARTIAMEAIARRTELEVAWAGQTNGARVVTA